MEIPLPGVTNDLSSLNPLASQFGHLSVQDRAFLDAFNRQEQQELSAPRSLAEASTVLGQLEQTVQTAVTNNKGGLTRQPSIGQSAVAAVTALYPGAQPDQPQQHNLPSRRHDIVTELVPEEVMLLLV